VPSTQQADNLIHEDQLLNFLVNRVDEEIELDFAPNAQATSEYIYEVLVSACADGTSVSTLCEKSDDSLHQNTVLYHLRKKFDLESVEQAGRVIELSSKELFSPKNSSNRLLDRSCVLNDGRRIHIFS